MSRIPEEEHHVGGGLRKDFHCLDYGEFESFVLLSEFCEEDGGGAVQCENSTYIYDAVPESLVAQC